MAKTRNTFIAFVVDTSFKMNQKIDSKITCLDATKSCLEAFISTRTPNSEEKYVLIGSNGKFLATWKDSASVFLETVKLLQANDCHQVSQSLSKAFELLHAFGIASKMEVLGDSYKLGNVQFSQIFVFTNSGMDLKIQNSDRLDLGFEYYTEPYRWNQRVLLVTFGVTPNLIAANLAARTSGSVCLHTIPSLLVKWFREILDSKQQRGYSIELRFQDLILNGFLHETDKPWSWPFRDSNFHEVKIRSSIPAFELVAGPKIGRIPDKLIFSEHTIAVPSKLPIINADQCFHVYSYDSQRNTSDQFPFAVIYPSKIPEVATMTLFPYNFSHLFKQISEKRDLTAYLLEIPGCFVDATVAALRSMGYSLFSDPIREVEQFVVPKNILTSCQILANSLKHSGRDKIAPKTHKLLTISQLRQFESADLLKILKTSRSIFNHTVTHGSEMANHASSKSSVPISAMGDFKPIVEAQQVLRNVFDESEPKRMAFTNPYKKDSKTRSINIEDINDVDLLSYTTPVNTSAPVSEVDAIEPRHFFQDFTTELTELIRHIRNPGPMSESFTELVDFLHRKSSNYTEAIVFLQQEAGKFKKRRVIAYLESKLDHHDI